MANDTSETFETERSFEADPDTVWEAITEADQLSKWFGAEVDFSPIPGSEGTVDFPDDEGGTRVLLVEEVEAGERLALRWASMTEAPTQVTFEIFPDGTGTRLVITERILHGTMMMAGAQLAASPK